MFIQEWAQYGSIVLCNEERAKRSRWRVKLDIKP